MIVYLMDLNAEQTKQAITLARAVSDWLQTLPSQEKLDEYKTALNALRAAIRKTRSYQDGLREGRQRDADAENELSDVWMSLYQKVHPLDEALAKLCFVKGWGWADQKVWDLPEYRNLPIHLDQMVSEHVKALERVTSHEEAMEAIKRVTRGHISFDPAPVARDVIARSAWVNGSFYLFAALSVVSLLLFVARTAPWYTVPAIVVGGILFTTVIGALQLRQDERLSGEDFLKLMGLSLRQLPLVRLVARRPQNSEPEAGRNVARTPDRASKKL